MTANSLGIPVIAGPTEATALGNILLQLIALGDISSIEEGRALLRKQEKVKEYLPNDMESWERAYKKFCKIIIK